MYTYKFQLLIRKCFTTNICACRYSPRYLCTSCAVSCLLILFLVRFEIFKRQPNPFDDGRDRPKYCSQSVIRKHYMYDQSPEQLFIQDPTRPSFTYILPNGNSCSVIKPHAIIFVVSKSTNFASRDAIRRTWGNFAHITSIKTFAHLRLKLLFLIDIDEPYLLNINLEQTIFNDLVQVRLPQYYTLSTYRDMAILHWVETYCSHASMTIKTDDDVFLNTFLLAKVLTKTIANVSVRQSKTECKHVKNVDPLAAIYGVQVQDGQVIRNSNDPTSEETRYIITDDEYPCRYYPDYMSGFGYIVNRHARVQLLCAFFRHEKSFHMSDVYVTGILPEYLNIQRRDLLFQISYRATDDCDLFFIENDSYACASSLHYKKDKFSPLTGAYIFERFNLYWKRVCRNRLLYTN